MRKIIFYTLTLFLTMGMTTSAHALTVSPAKIEIAADPGQTVGGEIDLFNEQEEAKTFFTSYENFESRGDSGAPYFTGAGSGLATWIFTDSEVTLAPGERIQVPYKITIPEDAKPGGYFSAIFFGSQPVRGVEGGEVSIGGKIGVLVLLRVSGEVEESAGLVDFSARDGRRLFSALPIIFEYGFNNTGGDRVVPRGEIKIKNTLQFTSATLLANENQGSVLPNSTRSFEITWGEKQSESEKSGFFNTALAQLTNFHLGWYSADISLVWGESAQRTNDSFNFFIIPWQLLLIILVLFVGIWLVFKLWIGRFKRRILAEATQTNNE